MACALPGVRAMMVGCPLAERPHHLHIVDVLDNWLFNQYINEEQHIKLTKYVI